MSSTTDGHGPASPPAPNRWRTVRRVVARVIAGGVGVMGLLDVWLGSTLFLNPIGPVNQSMVVIGLFMIVYGLIAMSLAALVLFAYSQPSMRGLNAFIGINVWLMLTEPLRNLVAWGLGVRGIAIDQWAFAGSIIAGLATYHLLNWIYDRDFPLRPPFLHALESSERNTIPR